jgi:hypothetical protein
VAITFIAFSWGDRQKSGRALGSSRLFGAGVEVVSEYSFTDRG